MLDSNFFLVVFLLGPDTANINRNLQQNYGPVGGLVPADRFAIFHFHITAGQGGGLGISQINLRHGSAVASTINANRFASGQWRVQPTRGNGLPCFSCAADQAWTPIAGAVPTVGIGGEIPFLS